MTERQPPRPRFPQRPGGPPNSDREGPPPPPEKPNNQKPLREMLYLNEIAAYSGMKAIPGDEWALHYPKNGDTRQQVLQGLLDGKYQPTPEMARDLQPNAIMYDEKDIERLGVEAMAERVREACEYHKLFDYQRFAEYVASMKGRDIPIETLQETYEGVFKTRNQKRVYDAVNRFDQLKMEESFKKEVEWANSHWTQLSPTQRVIASLKQDWLANGLGVLDPQLSELTAQLLTPEERKLFEQMKEPFNKFVQRGDYSQYKELIQKITDQFPSIVPSPTPPDQMSKEMEELQKELEQYQEQVGPPVSDKDPGIPPEDQDEYHTPPPQEAGKGKESAPQEVIFFEITPPLNGYYIVGRKSYYDVDNKVWSKKKQLSGYTTHITGGTDRHTISANLDTTLKALPLPKTYAVDMQTLTASDSAHVTVYRDQNGCFYVQASAPCRFGVEFLKEPQPFAEQTIPEDLAPMYRGSLSAATEDVIRLLQGTAVEKAKQAQSYIHTHHFYPGGGDLQAAQALQHKLRTESTGDNYLQNIDASHYLECYSANTLFCAMVRKAGIPARLVVGNRVKGAKNGVSVINSSTGHAWSEIWDGQQWVRFDATPAPKPEDKKKDQQDEPDQQGESGDQQPDQSEKPEQSEQPQENQDQGSDQPVPDADDGAADQTPPTQQGTQDNTDQQDKGQSEPSGESSDQPGQSSQQPGEASDQAGSSSDQMSEASDQAIQQGQKKLEEAQKAVNEMKQKAEKIEDAISKAKSFKELQDLQKKLEQEDMFESMKDALEEKAEDKEENLQKELRDKLEEMMEDGFIDEKKRDKLLEKMKDADTNTWDQIKREIDQEATLYDQYDAMREKVMPYVEQWYKYFAERLPTIDTIDLDDGLTRPGRLNKRAVQNPRNLIMLNVNNRPKIESSIEPKFLASIMVDMSGSMAGIKREIAFFLLVFLNELFSRISEEYGYIRYAIYTFAQYVKQVKGFDQDYLSAERYQYPDGIMATIKAYLMTALSAKGGTDMLSAVKQAGEDLNEQIAKFPDFASALYFIGDGADSFGNSKNINTYLSRRDADMGGFGRHMTSAIMIGEENLRQLLAQTFGDDRTQVGKNAEDLIEKFMYQFEEDIVQYLKDIQR